MGRQRIAGYGLVLALAAVTYLHDLSSPHIPKNGDEYPYTHITRLTAASGRLLPLRSDLPGMRNTKPPLLFWQGIASTRWGRSFGLASLRYPSVVYTFLTAGLAFLLGRRLVRDGDPDEAGLVAALAYLAFFSTYRYGRPFLTNAPETFWLFLLVFILLYGRPASFASRALVPGVMGLALGIALLYKSFALALPAGLALALFHLDSRGYRLREAVAKDLGKVTLAVVLALAFFGSWFLLDPDPRAVWDEFVMRENVGKFDVGGSYLLGLLWGRFSIPSLFVGSLLNAGLLVLPVAALLASAWRRRRDLDQAERLLWIWVLTFFAVYCLPSQRSSRYLLPAMPAMAVLLALGWSRLPRRVITATLVLAALPLAVIVALSLGVRDTLPEAASFGAGHWFVLGLAVAVWAGTLRWPDTLGPPGVLGTVLLVLLSFSSLLQPLAGPAGVYDEAARQAVAGRDVWVPVDFTAKEEGYRLLLPGARVHPYPDRRENVVDEVLERHPVVVVRLRPGDPTGEGVLVLGERLDLRGRHTGAEVRAMLGGELFEHLFIREVLVERPEGHGS